MADLTGYDNKQPIGGDQSYDIVIDIDVSTLEGYACNIVYADMPKAAPVAKYSLNVVTGYTQHLETISAGTSSTVRVHFQRADADALVEGRKLDIIFMRQSADANYASSDKRILDVSPFATVVKGVVAQPSLG